MTRRASQAAVGLAAAALLLTGCTDAGGASNREQAARNKQEQQEKDAAARAESAQAATQWRQDVAAYVQPGLDSAMAPFPADMNAVPEDQRSKHIAHLVDRLTAWREGIPQLADLPEPHDPTYTEALRQQDELTRRISETSDAIYLFADQFAPEPRRLSTRLALALNQSSYDQQGRTLFDQLVAADGDPPAQAAVHDEMAAANERARAAVEQVDVPGLAEPVKDDMLAAFDAQAEYHRQYAASYRDPATPQPASLDISDPRQTPQRFGERVQRLASGAATRADELVAFAAALPNS